MIDQSMAYTQLPSMTAPPEFQVRADGAVIDGWSKVQNKDDDVGTTSAGFILKVDTILRLRMRLLLPQAEHGLTDP